MRKILFRIKNRDDWYYGYPMSEIKNNTVAFIGDKNWEAITMIYLQMQPHSVNSLDYMTGKAK